MTNVVVAMEATGRTRQGIAPAQPCATRDSAQINSKRGKATASRNSAAYQPLRMRAGGSDDRDLNRGGIVANVKFLPATQSALSNAFADTGVLSHALPARLRFKFVGAFTALQAVFPCLHSALRVLQDFACNEAKSMADFIVHKAHRGPGDTVDAAMHRAERLYGVPATWLHRLRYREVGDMPTSAFFAIFNAYRAACDLADRAYENERAKHAPDTALVRFADIVAGKTTEKEEAK